jgi:hypothetical protein
MKKKPELKSVRIYCPKLDQNVTINVKNIMAHGRSDDCEMCGSHGDVSIDVKCKCGKRHDIELHSW